MDTYGQRAGSFDQRQDEDLRQLRQRHDIDAAGIALSGRPRGQRTTARTYPVRHPLGRDLGKIFRSQSRRYNAPS